MRKGFPRTIIKKSKRGGFGLFAAENIPVGAKIIEYVGEKIDLREYRRRTRFYDSIGFNCLFGLTDQVVIDGLVGGNESRFINHSVTKTNVVPIIERSRIWFYAEKDVKSGEELLFDYGFDPRPKAKR